MKVFPAYAGVILEDWESGKRTVRVPRVCGGDPQLYYYGL